MEDSEKEVIGFHHGRMRTLSLYIYQHSAGTAAG